MKFKTSEVPHRRLNPLTGEWLLLSPQRTGRPWEGKKEKAGSSNKKPYEETCYLCPGNTRANGDVNPDYKNTFVFTNDFPALKTDTIESDHSLSNLFKTETVSGTCRVICFSRRHDLTLAEMECSDIESVIAIWQEQSKELGSRYQWVQIFENKGEIMGCSNAHPHGQIWASSYLPEEPGKEDNQQAGYLKNRGSVLLMDYLEAELDYQDRIIVENDTWVCLIPFWAIWPFETMLLPKQQVLRLEDLDMKQKTGLSEIIKSMLVRYDNIFNTSFPYSMGWHGAPYNQRDNRHWQLHAHYYPPLLRSATVKKFMVGYEMLGNPQRDITPESAAEMMRKQSDTHYKVSRK